MTIQINTDKNLNVQEAFGTKLDSLLYTDLNRFSKRMTRLEVHQSDENSSKEGINDKRCMLEARLEGRRPIAVTGLANTYELAVNKAIGKLKTTLDTILGRLRNH